MSDILAWILGLIIGFFFFVVPILVLILLMFLVLILLVKGIVRMMDNSAGQDS